MGQRGLHEIVSEALELIKIRKGLAPIKPRILIIGPRGSGRKTQADMLAEKLKVVHGRYHILFLINRTMYTNKQQNWEDFLAHTSQI